MSQREDKERLATWIDKRLAKVVRVHAAVRGMTIQDIYEQGLALWIEAHPLTAEDVTDNLLIWSEENHDD